MKEVIFYLCGIFSCMIIWFLWAIIAYKKAKEAPLKEYARIHIDRGNIFSASDTEKKQNTVAYVARFTKDCKCYSAAGKTQAKMFPVIKKNAVVDVMKYTETVKGKRWYFIRIPYPNDEGFVREFVPAGYFKKLI